MSKTRLFLLSAGSTQEDLSRHNRKIVDWDVKNQIKQTNRSVMTCATQQRDIPDCVSAPLFVCCVESKIGIDASSRFSRRFCLNDLSIDGMVGA